MVSLRAFFIALILLSSACFFNLPGIAAENNPVPLTEPQTETLLSGAQLDEMAVNLPVKRSGFWLPQNISTIGEKVDSLFYFILVMTGLIFLGVQGVLIYFIFKYRSGVHPKGFYTHGNRLAEIIWTLIPVLILTALAFWGQQVWKEVKRTFPDTADTIKIRVQAEQYAWNMQYPGADGLFDTPDDIKNINQMHIPAGKPVRVTLTSIEKEGAPAVIHSFFLPDFRIKQDVVPGMAIDVWFQALRTGQYEIACAEFCGLGHYRMKGFLTIHTPEGYQNWLKSQETAA